MPSLQYGLGMPHPKEHWIPLQYQDLAAASQSPNRTNDRSIQPECTTASKNLIVFRSIAVLAYSPFVLALIPKRSWPVLGRYRPCKDAASICHANFTCCHVRLNVVAHGEADASCRCPMGKPFSELLASSILSLSGSSSPSRLTWQSFRTKIMAVLRHDYRSPLARWRFVSFGWRGTF